MPDFSLTLNEDQQQIQKWTHDFAEGVIRPAAHEWDEREEFPYPVVQEAAEIGLYSVDFLINAMGDPTGLTLPVAVEEIFWGDAGIGMAIMGSGLAAAGIAGNGTPEQVMEWVPQCYGTPDKIALGAFCVSEPDAGSDVSSLRTRAVYDEATDEWVLNGTKAWITNGGIADVHVDRRRRRPRAQGPRSGQLRGAARHEGSVAGPEVPEARHPRIAHGRGRARRRAHPRQLSARRQGEARRQAGPSSRAGHDRREAAGDVDIRGHPPDRRRPGARHRPGRLRVLAEYAKERTAFGRPIIMNQAIAFKLANMITEIDASRLLIWRAAWLARNGGYQNAEGSMSKYKASEVSVRVTEDAIQILGGYGYTREYPVERWHRDAKIHTIFEGTSEIQQLVIARAISGLRIE